MLSKNKSYCCSETVLWQLRHQPFKHWIKWIVLGAVYVNKVMLLITNISATLLRGVFHMQKVKVTTAKFQFASSSVYHLLFGCLC